MKWKPLNVQKDPVCLNSHWPYYRDKKRGVFVIFAFLFHLKKKLKNIKTNLVHSSFRLDKLNKSSSFMCSLSFIQSSIHLKAITGNLVDSIHNWWLSLRGTFVVYFFINLSAAYLFNYTLNDNDFTIGAIDVEWWR